MRRIVKGQTSHITGIGVCNCWFCVFVIFHVVYIWDICVCVRVRVCDIL